jgi:hypothetical protein
MRQQTQSMGDMPPPMTVVRQQAESETRLDAFTFGEFTAGWSIGFQTISGKQCANVLRTKTVATV